MSSHSYSMTVKCPKGGRGPDPLKVKCPACDAAAGERCRTSGNNVARVAHASRRELVERGWMKLKESGSKDTSAASERLRLSAAAAVRKVTGAASCNFGGRFLELAFSVTDGRLGLVVLKQMYRGMRFAPTVAGGDDGHVYTSNSVGVEIISSERSECALCALHVRGPEAKNDDDRLLVPGDDPLQTLKRFAIAVKEYNEHMERLEAGELPHVEPDKENTYMAVAPCGDVTQSKNRDVIIEFILQHHNDPGEIQVLRGRMNHLVRADGSRGGFAFLGHPLEYTAEFVVDIKTKE